MARQSKAAASDHQIRPSAISRRWSVGLLAAILLTAGALRLVRLGSCPPGLHQDEAANAWNAWCLLHTGRDQVGARWPIYYMRALGSNRTTPHIYATIPFQALGGLNVWTTRLPIALAGILTVLLLYLVGKHLFGVAAGLVAAAMLAVNPWHIQLSRLAFGAGLCPLIVTGALAAMLWARLPLTDNHSRPRPLLAGLAGLAAGAGCYGYQAVRLFLPAFVFAVALITCRRWLALLKSRRGAAAVAAFFIGFTATFGPLAWKHLTDPQMSRRGESLWVWQQQDTPLRKIGKVLARYPEHFGLKFLFVKGDFQPKGFPWLLQSAPSHGQFHWYSLPLMLIGLGVILRRVRRSPAERILLVWVVLYPIGDLLTRNVGPHGLRSSPGLCGLILLAAVGAAAAGSWLRRQGRGLVAPAACALVIAVIASNAVLIRRIFVDYGKSPGVYQIYHADLKEACDWLRPRLDRYDAVFCTAWDMNRPYIMVLTHLRYDPHQWLADEKEVDTTGRFDVHFRFGKFHFLYNRPQTMAWLKQLSEKGRPDRVAFIIRPGQLKKLKPSYVVRRPDGQVVLWVCEDNI